MTASYAVDDAFGSQIATGLESFAAAKRRGQEYLSDRDDAPAVLIYEDVKGGEAWVLKRDGGVVKTAPDPADVWRSVPLE